MTEFKKTWFGRLLARIANFWVKTVDYVESLLEPLIPEIRELAVAEVQQLGAVALAAIKKAAAEGKKPEDWLDPAYDAIKAELPRIGKDLSSSAINLLATIFQAHAKAQAVKEGTLVMHIAQAESDQPVVA